MCAIGVGRCGMTVKTHRFCSSLKRRAEVHADDQMTDRRRREYTGMDVTPLTLGVTFAR